MEPCLHEKDFGILFTKVDYMTEILKTQSITMAALKTAIDASLKYQISVEAIDQNKEKNKLPHLYRTAIIISSILTLGGIFVTLIIEFHR